MCSHLRCDARVRVPFITHCAICVLLGVDNISNHDCLPGHSVYIEDINDSGLKSAGIELIHDTCITITYGEQDSCITNCKCGIDAIQHFQW